MAVTTETQTHIVNYRKCYLFGEPKRDDQGPVTPSAMHADEDLREDWEKAGLTRPFTKTEDVFIGVQAVFFVLHGGLAFIQAFT